MRRDRKIRVALYAQQPFVAHGLAAVLRACRDLRLVTCQDTLHDLLASLQSSVPDVLLVYVMNGVSLSDLHAIREVDSRCRVVLWGQDFERDFAFQAMQLGVRGILAGTTPAAELLAALRSVDTGALCFERDLLENVLSQKPVALTMRQRQIVSLVAQGCRNKEIASAMGITEGTVKVYLYKLFKKLGVSDRLDMALFGRKSLFSGEAGLTPFPEKQGLSSIRLMPRKPDGFMVQ